MNAPVLFLIIGALQVAMWIYTLYLILTNRELEALQKGIWLVIITVVPLLGCLLYLLSKKRTLNV